MQSSDEASFTALVERQSRFAFQVAYSVLRNAHDAEDAVQEMLLRLYRRRAWLDLQDERAFLARATWRVAVDKLRQRRPATALGEEGIELTATGPDPEHLAIAADFSAMVHALADRLPEDLRQPLSLASLNQMNSCEIAAIMGIPEGTVRTRLLRARKLLRDKIAAIEERRGVRPGR